jgi:hypothetical protein
MALHLFCAYDNMRECCEGVVATRVAKSLEHVFRQVIHVVDRMVVPIEGNLKVFPCCLYSISTAHCNLEMVNHCRCYEEGIQIWERTNMSAHCKRDIVEIVTKVSFDGLFLLKVKTL